MLRTTSAVFVPLLVGALFLWACDKGEEGTTEESEQAVESSEESAPAEPEGPDSTRLIVGTWHNDILEEARMTFNSAGRVYTSFGNCQGSYTIEGARIQLNYDEGQPNCMSMGSSMTFDNDDHLTISGAPYTRDDSVDVADLSTLLPPSETPEVAEGTGTATP